MARKNHVGAPKGSRKLGYGLIPVVTLVLLVLTALPVLASTLMHNSDNLPNPANPKWGGSWGVAGGMYGAFTCSTCHSSTTANIKRVVTSIPDNIGPASTGGKPVYFMNVTGYGDDGTPHATSRHICEVCHTQTSVHRYDSTGQSDLNHQGANNTDCIKCHSHNKGFAASCTGCHGNDQASGTPMATGKHSAHINTTLNPAIGTALDCVNCHAKTVSANDTVSTPANHRNGFVDFSGARAGGSSTYDTAAGACASAYCHSDGKGRQNAPFSIANGWKSTATITDCKGCHGNDSTTGAFTSSYGEPNYSNEGAGALRANSHKTANNRHVTSASDCGYCHSATTASGVAILPGSTTHADGTITLAAGGGKSFTWTAGSKTCSGISCHGGNSAVWGSNLGCVGCHGGDAVSGAPMATGKHTAHVNNESFLGTNYGCVECHARTVSGNTTISTGANHQNGFKDYSGVKAGTYNSSTGNCSTAYCHTDGKGTATTFTAGNGWRSAATLTCTGCHGNDAAPAFISLAGEPNYSNAGAGATRANNHRKHLDSLGATACVNCHSATTTTGTSIIGSHTNGSIDLVPGPGRSFGWTPVTKTCNAISCHNNGNATWGQVLNCQNCHAGLIASGSHAIHMGGINLNGGVTMYNYTTNVSSGASYGFGCANCHPVDKANHMNGAVNVELNNTANVGYLRSRNAVVAGTGYNAIAKQCDNVYCHSDGITTPTAANTPVWGGSFAAADHCANCHGNSPATGAHSVHVVGIHYDNIYNGTSGLLTAGSTGAVNHGDPTQATTLNCDICHNNTVQSSANDNNTVCKTCHGVSAAPRGAAAIANRTFHVNGRVDISFKDVAVVSKAQLRKATFDLYSTVWGRNGGNYKNGTAAYDTANHSLTFGNFSAAAGLQGAGSCANIACHLNNTIKWSDSGNVTCQTCHTSL